MKQIVNTKIRRIILRRKIYQFIDEWVTGENISAILLFIILVICVSLKRNIDKLKPTDIVDFSLIISFIILFLSKLVSNALLKPIRRVCEDAAKLSINYEELAKKYKDIYLSLLYVLPYIIASIFAEGLSNEG